jgi:purine nucleoside phosphorylase
MANDIKIGIIGGSGLYQMAGLSDIEEVVIETPFGKPSDAYRLEHWKAGASHSWPVIIAITRSHRQN